jgi:hypothetical protein
VRLARRRAHGAAALPASLLVLAVAGCGGSTGPVPTVAATSTPPPGVILPALDGDGVKKLHRLLALPVATPAVCHSADGTSDGQPSPWDATVDFSVYLRPGASAAAIGAVGRFLRGRPEVASAYFESARQGYAEFTRLYTCSAALSAKRTPPAYRVSLRGGTTFGQRDALIARVLRLPAVERFGVACTPELACVDVVRSAGATPAASPAPCGARHDPVTRSQAGNSSPTGTATPVTLPAGASGQAQAGS